MIATDDQLISTTFAGRVRVHGPASSALAALHLGAKGRPSWEAIRKLGPTRYEAEPISQGQTHVEPFQRDFGDSLVHGASNAPATCSILPTHHPGDPRHLPAAMSFAFAQQWARLGLACIHGALLTVADQGVLVLGHKGAGKSVLATSALVAGGRLVSDDYLLAGIRDDVLWGERIRAFVSLRQSWAARSLFEAAGTRWQTNRGGTRAFLPVDADDPRFPDHARIDHIWLLTRPRAGRRRDSNLEPIPQATLFAALVSAAQPLLLGPDFPHEDRLLTDLFLRLASHAQPARLETGQDIVLEPRTTWSRLLHPPRP